MTTVDNISLSTFYESIIENAESNILILDADFSIISFNPRLYWTLLEMYEIQPLRGANLFELLSPVAPEVSERWRSKCRNAFRGLSISDEEEFFANGKRVCWKIYYKCVEQNNQRYIAILFRDFTAEKKYQEKVLLHESNVRAILNSIPFSIWLLSENLDLLDFNERGYDHFQISYSATLVPGRKFLDFFPEAMPDAKERWRLLLERALDANEAVTDEEHVRSIFEDAIYSLAIVPVPLQKGETGLRVSMEDVSERHAMRKHFQSKLNELGELNADLGKVIQIVANESQAPCLLLKDLLRSLQRDPLVDEKSLMPINTSINKISTLLRHLQDVAINVSSTQSGEIDFDLLLQNVLVDLHDDGLPPLIVKQEITREAKFVNDYNSLKVIYYNVLLHTGQLHQHENEMEIIVKQLHESIILKFVANNKLISQEHIYQPFQMASRSLQYGTRRDLPLHIISLTVAKLGGTIEIHSEAGLPYSISVEIPNQREL